MGKAERLHRTSKIVRKRLPFVEKIYRTFRGEISSIPAKRYGQCRDRHPWDCGHSKCYVCHCDKLDQIPTLQKLRSDLDFKEYLQ